VILSGQHASALVHCGWRGLHANILSIIVDDLRSQHLIKPADTNIIIWPGICQEHYQVTPDVSDLFPNDTADSLLNLKSVIHKELLRLKFSPANISSPDFCSFHTKINGDHIFSSHRRNADPTRNVVFMSINLSA